jgi:hypothetical protein
VSTAGGKPGFATRERRLNDVVPRPRRPDETSDRARIEEAQAEAARRGASVFLPAGEYDFR